MKIAKLHVSSELLRAVLMLPEGVTVIGAAVSELYGDVELTLTGDALPVSKMLEGQTYHWIHASPTTTQHDCGHRTLKVEYKRSWYLGPPCASSGHDILREYRKNPAQD